MAEFPQWGQSILVASAHVSSHATATCFTSTVRRRLNMAGAIRTEHRPCACPSHHTLMVIVFRIADEGNCGHVACAIRRRVAVMDLAYEGAMASQAPSTGVPMGLNFVFPWENAQSVVPDMLTIGSMLRTSPMAYFSSYRVVVDGYTPDGRDPVFDRTLRGMCPIQAGGVLLMSGLIGRRGDDGYVLCSSRASGLADM